MGATLSAYVVVATRGRPGETFTLLSALAAQTQLPEQIVVVGADLSDLTGLDQHALCRSGAALLVTSGRAGLTAQRNVGLDYLTTDLASAEGFVAFFDDDFRPAPDWLERCRERFETEPDLAGLTGRVLGDGVRGQAISEAHAERLIDGRDDPLPHWSGGAAPREVGSLYGCNMAFAASVCRTLRFDESLPLYGWQEDCDYTGQARRKGRTIVVPECRGVHLGVKAGRQSGVKFGYSQIANPIHIARRRNMTAKRAAVFVMRALAANTLRSVPTPGLFDYRGRLAGNLRAIVDLVLGRCDPRRILSLP